MASLVLTEGDREVLRWLYMLRLMSVDQLRRVRYYQDETGRLSSLDNVRKRLRRLEKAGYLFGDLLVEGRERIYYLGEEAAAPLSELLGVPQKRVYRPRLESTRQIQHPLMVSECAVRVTEAIRGTDVTTPDLPPLGISYYHTHAVEQATRRKAVERFVTQEDLEVGETRHRIRPDLVFALQRSSVARLFFLEADRGFEEPAVLLEKQIGYHHYRELGRFRKYGEVQDFRVLLVTTNKKRVDLLHRHLSRAAGEDLTFVATYDDVQTRDPVFDPIWLKKTGEGALLRR